MSDQITVTHRVSLHVRSINPEPIRIVGSLEDLRDDEIEPTGGQGENVARVQVRGRK